MWVVCSLVVIWSQLFFDCPMGRLRRHILLARIGHGLVGGFLVAVSFFIQDAYGDTALHDAIGKGSTDIISRLVDYPGADFTICNKRGFIVLHHAALKGNARYSVASRQPPPVIWAGRSGCVFVLSLALGESPNLSRVRTSPMEMSISVMRGDAIFLSRLPRLIGSADRCTLVAGVLHFVFY